MSSITVFNGIFCGESAVIQDVIASTGLKPVTDDDIVEQAAKRSGAPESKIQRAFSTKTSVFNQFTHEKECAIAHLRLAMAEKLSESNLIIVGFSGLLIPKTISHILRVCLIADMGSRIDQAAAELNFSEKEAVKIIHQDDENRVKWVNTLFSTDNPWEESLYDMLIPMDKIKSYQAGALIEENLLKEVVRPTKKSIQAVQDFLLSSQTEVALCEAGHSVMVTAKNGAVVLTINKHVLMLSRLEKELKSIAQNVPGVITVETRSGKGFHQSNIYWKHHLETPSKVLLVDDEREFAQTLSERLMLRDMGSAIVYDGESALNVVEEDDPEVIIIDLKMPGVSGIEVLKRVKKTRQEIEVIVLTGHGSESDKKLCMDLGAFAYLQKPVDINVLSEAIKKAYEKIHSNRVP
jgi:CheY-like chemotaxis protein